MYRTRWLLLIALLVPSAGLAQPTPTPAQKQEAAERFERGVQLFKEQAYRAAVVEFQRAYDLSPDYRLLYNLGRAKQQLQDYLGAARDYEAYLTRGGASVPAERRTQVEETLATLGGRVGRIDVVVNRPGAEVYLDDQRIGTAPLGSLAMTNVGRHRVSARAADGTVGAELVDVAGGDIAEVRIVLAENAGAARRSLAAGEAAERAWSMQQKVALASLVAGGASLGASVATGVLSLRAKDDLDDKLGTLGVDRAEVASQRDKVDRLSLGTDVLIGVGAALAVTGTVLWVLSGRRADRDERTRETSQTRLGLRIGTRALALTGSF